MSERVKAVEVTLENIGGGIPSKLLSYEFEKVLKNIADKNTEATHKRKITLTFEIVPNKERGVAGVKVSSHSNLAKMKGKATVVHFATDGKDIKAYEFAHTPQPMLPGVEDPKIRNIAEGR